jgi:hypothetical protein
MKDNRFIRFQKFASTILTNETKLGDIPPWKLSIIVVVIIIIVFGANIEQRSSRLIEWLLYPDHFINLAVDWHGDHPSGIAVTVVDIDDSSFEAWGQPLSAPRDKLFDLIDALDARGAATIVVDIDLTAGPTSDEVNFAVERLSAYTIRARTGRGTATPLILVRGLWEVPRELDDLKIVEVRIPSHAGGKGMSSLAASIKNLDAFVSSSGMSSGNVSVMWGSAQFNTDAIGVIRNWRLVETVCSAEATKQRSFFPLL